MARNTKMIIAALATALVATLGVAAPADAAKPPVQQRSYAGGGGWCC
jgi:hypothetical protein